VGISKLYFHLGRMGSISIIFFNLGGYGTKLLSSRRAQ